MSISKNEDGLISGANFCVEFQAILKDKEIDTKALEELLKKDNIKDDPDFRGAQYSYKYEDPKNYISVMGWEEWWVEEVANFFLKYLKKSISLEAVYNLRNRGTL